MKVTLLGAPSLQVAIFAARTCYDSFDKMDSSAWSDELGKRDMELLYGIIDSGHESVLEHLTYFYSIEGISRGLLQELVRHRMASFSVQSTRFTLKKFKKENVGDLFVHTGDQKIDDMVHRQIDDALKLEGVTNDVLKYALPEAVKTDVALTINARSLRNLLRLRLSKRALAEFQALARLLFLTLPEEHRVIYSDIPEVIELVILENVGSETIN